MIMTTFVLKKYEEPTQSPNSESELNNDEPTNQEEEKGLVIKVEGSVAEIVAHALHQALGNQANIEQKQDDLEKNGQVDANVKTVSTEEINLDPIKSFNQIEKDDVVFIQNKGFKTAKEDWFLLNLENKTKNVFYSVESLINYVKARLNVVWRLNKLLMRYLLK